MDKIKIITDGSCDLSHEVLNKFNINVVPLGVSFGEEHYTAGVDIDNKEFYAKMKDSKELPKTFCPSPENFCKEYQCEEDKIIVIALSSKLSGTYNSASLARDLYLSEHKEKDIRVIDSMTGSIGAGLLLIKAAKMISEGKDIDEIVEAIENLKEKISFYGTLETLENAIKGGRINPLAGKIIGALNFKAIVQIKDGVVKPIDKARGESNSIKKVANYITSSIEDTKDKILCLMHANCPEKAHKLLSIIEKTHKFDEVYISEVGPVMGTYTSEGAVLGAVL
ncbi:EDD domain protein, DegV family [Intestinibacter bartlettii DSM 16795]|jgi:DegV family protein with EDD domain|uniref:DegV family protein n=1 Tax=Intestinibacter bartlettii TaxID=261299 RepID=UPI0001631322|nr:DegV family protein [Intestinibacter bartlettii]EDQ95400.1 EDD domain protein, DegV family [Intestinibacter bartlettii DSM 16795]MDU2163606.1 DegV family protein [Intestinibacter bartlettii]MEE0616210.1 DegV family protein [Intestinibacter bartlettii]UWO80363.1 DegV family protein [Intestinibacter bartlettii]SKA53930.1 EDD domain protein, DegV family [Intestinibacter bartlettii DSM 16795]